MPILDPDDFFDLAAGIFDSAADALAGFLGSTDDLVEQLVASADPTAVEKITEAWDGTFGGYPSQIDSSYHPIVSADGTAYLSPSDAVKGVNGYTPIK